MKTLTCKKCGYSWNPRIEKLPKACPNCKQYSWNKPAKRLAARDNKTAI